MTVQHPRHDGHEDAETANGHTLVIWNSRSRTGDQNRMLRKAISATPGVQVIEVFSVGEVRPALEQWASHGLKRIVAAGGDGTVNAVASAIVASQRDPIEFAVLPLGTGNDLARSLGMPLVPEEAWPLCLAGEVRPIDLMKLSAGEEIHFAVNMITGGNTGSYSAVITDEDKQQWGPHCYLHGVVNVLSRLKVFLIDYRIDEGEWRTESVLNLFVANGRTSGGGLLVAPEASLADGQFDVILIRNGTVVDLASLAVDYAVARFLEHELVCFAKARKLEIRCAEPLDLSIDGDAIKGGRDFRIDCLASPLLAVFAPDAKRRTHDSRK